MILDYPPSSKRSHLRAPILVTHVRMGEDRKYFFGYAKNISLSGIFIQTVTPKDVGEEFNIEFILPKTEITVKCRCRVIWNRRYSEGGKYEPGMGLKFEEIDPVLAAQVAEWVKGHTDTEII